MKPFPILALSDPSLVVAIALIAMVTSIMIVALIRYEADNVVKIWSGLGTLVGILSGSMATYFFTKDANEKELAAKAGEVEIVKSKAELLEGQLALANEQVEVSQSMARVFSTEARGTDGTVSDWLNRPRFFRLDTGYPTGGRDSGEEDAPIVAPE